jgi:hypothetical protein
MVVEDIVNLIVESGAVPALVRHLQASQSKEVAEPRPYEHEVEKGSAFTLGLLAIKVLFHYSLAVSHCACLSVHI